MLKKKMRAFGKDIYLLGKDKEGRLRWLEAPSWDCDWYWGFGYVESYTNNRRPDLSRDICEHTHFDSLFLKGKESAHKEFLKFFEDTPLEDDEIWLLTDYMMTFYTLRKTSDLVYCGNSHQTSKANIDVMKNESIYNEINKVMLPELFKKIKDLLTIEKED